MIIIDFFKIRIKFILHGMNLKRLCRNMEFVGSFGHYSVLI